MLKRLRRRRTGFTLVELLIVVAIIALLAAMAFFALLRARIATSEQMALQTLRNVRHALDMYVIVKQAYPPDLTELGLPKSDPPFLPPNQIGTGMTFTRQGYVFVYAPPGGSTYTLLANPQTYRVTGERHFLTDNSQAVYFTSEDRDALVTDPVVQ